MKRLTMLKAGAALMAGLVLATPALAQRHERQREHEREHFRTPHWVFDDRFHHNHYYPAPGYAIAALPGGALTISFRGGRYFYRSGVWFTLGGPGYVVARPPVGIVVPVLPPAYTTVYMGGVPYYYANDVYYAAGPGGYVVAQPPMDPSAAAAPAQPPVAAPAAPSPAPGTWYYCDSTKTYYPYVQECKEGWRAVPATPPASR
jgi:hypothetical protein